jgi:DNA-binding transcriptional LysR family regulator
MDLRHLRYFIGVADAGSFARAAERLHISQPPLSMQIKDLEVELEVQLFERSAKGVRLTRAGEAFYAEARAVMARVEHARITAQRAQRGEQGELAVGFISIADYNVLPSALKHFRTQYPSVDVQLHELTTDAQLRELAAERLDVGIALAPVNDEQVEFVPLLAEKLVLAVPAEHAVARAKHPIALKDVHDESFVMTPRHLAPGLHDAATACFHAAGLSPQVSQYAKQMQTVISLVAGGFGVALVPESLRHLQRSGVAYLQLKDKTPLIETGLISRVGVSNPSVSRFKQCVAAAAAVFRAIGATTRATPLRKPQPRVRAPARVRKKA